MVIFKRLQGGIEMPETFPQGLKPSSFAATFGTTEVVPFQNSGAIGIFQKAVKPCPFKT
jgi:hypothetical protein